MTDLTSQIQELRTSVCEKTETIDTLRQELKDVNVGSVTSKMLNLSMRHTSETPHTVNKCSTTRRILWSNRCGKTSYRSAGSVFSDLAERLLCYHAVCISGRQPVGGNLHCTFLRFHCPGNTSLYFWGIADPN